MTVLCPSFDPLEGWYIIFHEKNGTKTRKKIISPLFYYHEMGVKPPVGAKFSQQEYADFAAESSLPPGALAAMFLPVMPPTFSLAPQIPPIPNSSPAVALGVPQFDEYYNEFQDPFLLNPLELPSMNSSPYNPPTMSELSGHMSSFYGFPNQFSSLPPISLASSMPNILHLPISSGLKPKYSSMQPFTSSKPYPSQSSMSSSFINKYGNLQAFMPCPSQLPSGYKNKYNNLKPSSTFNLPQFSASNSSKSNSNSMNSMSSFSPMSDSQPLKSNKISLSLMKPPSYYYGLQPSFSPPSYDDWSSIPSTSSGTGKNLPPIGTPNPKASSSTTSSASVNENYLPPPRYEHPNVADDMNVDELGELDQLDELFEDDVVNEIVDDETLNENYEMYVDEEEEEK